MDNKLFVSVIEATPIVGFGIRAFLSQELNIRVLGIYNSVTEFLDVDSSVRPKVVILGGLITKGTEVEAISVLKDKTDVGIIMFTNQSQWSVLRAYVDAGASGIVSTMSPVSELLSAVYAVEVGHTWISPEVRESPKLIGRKGCSGKTDSLSPRESEIAVMVSKGYTSKSIAEKLCVSIKTIETHRYRIFKKLNISHCVELANFVSARGMA